MPPVLVAGVGSYTLDATGAVTAILEKGVTTLATYGYDTLSRRSSLSRAGGLVTSYGYDGLSRIYTLTHAFSGGTGNETLTFAYNPADQVLSRSSNNASYAFTGLYNVNRSYGVNGLNQLTTSGSSTITYGAMGNLKSDGVTTYTYDSLSRLTATSNGTTLAYDPVDRLQKTTNSAGSVTQMLYDDGDLIGDYDGTGTLLRRYIHGPNLDEPLLQYSSASTSPPSTARNWYVADQEGSVVALADGNGAYVVAFSYDDYGIPSAANYGKFQYTGQAWINAVGLYYYKARWYSPSLGRFLQADPTGYNAGMNLYAYVGGDPINRADPSGMNWFSSIFDAVGDLFKQMVNPPPSATPTSSPTSQSSTTVSEVVVTANRPGNQPDPGRAFRNAVCAALMMCGAQDTSLINGPPSDKPFHQTNPEMPQEATPPPKAAQPTVGEQTTQRTAPPAPANTPKPNAPPADGPTFKGIPLTGYGLALFIILNTPGDSWHPGPAPQH